MNKLIYNEEEVKKFLDLFPDLVDDEVIFIALFQRNKHISSEDRQTLGLSRCNVIAREICTSKDKVITKLKRWEANPEGFLTNKGAPIPNNALVPYITVQPVSTVKAYQEFNRVMTEYLIELGHHRGPKENKQNTYDRIKKSQSLLLDCHQHAYSRKVFIDVDYDGPKDWWGVRELEEKLSAGGVRFIKVETNGGFHCLLRKDSIKFNYNTIIEEYKGYAQKLTMVGAVKYELEVSTNQAIPVPGCYQYGIFEVKVIGGNDEQV